MSRVLAFLKKMFIGGALAVGALIAIGLFTSMQQPSSRPTPPTTQASVAPQPAQVEVQPAPQKAPAPPTREEILEAIRLSDDLDKHRDVLVLATAAAINHYGYTLSEFENHGGWVRSPTYRPRKVYFTYGDRAHVSDRLYVDVETGELFR